MDQREELGDLNKAPLAAMVQIANLALAGLFQAALLFLVSAGLQLVFGVQKIVNLACGAIFALGAYFGITTAGYFLGIGAPSFLLVPILLLSGVVLAVVVGPSIERLLRQVYDRDGHFQLLMTFALILIFEDVIRFFWGSSPRQLGGSYLVYGQIDIGSGILVPVYNLIVIAFAVALAFAMHWLIDRTRFGAIVRATAENRLIGAAMGIRISRVYTLVFVLGAGLGTVGGALAIPVSAASLSMPIDLIVDAFAVVIIGGLGSMKGAFYGAIIVGLVKAAALATFPEIDMFAIYLIVITVLIFRPYGLFADKRSI